MANGHTTALIDEVDGLLEDGNIPTKTGIKMTLAVSRANYEQLQTVKTLHEDNYKELTDRIDKVEGQSIGVWIRKNPRPAIVFFALFCLVFISDFRQPVAFWLTSEWRSLFYWLIP